MFGISVIHGLLVELFDESVISSTLSLFCLGALHNKLFHKMKTTDRIGRMLYIAPETEIISVVHSLIIATSCTVEGQVDIGDGGDE